jgi:hypothetical protein
MATLDARAARRQGADRARIGVVLDGRGLISSARPEELMTRTLLVTLLALVALAPHAPARDKPIKAKTEVFDVTAPGGELGERLVAAIRDMEALCEGAKLGKKPRGRRMFFVSFDGKGPRPHRDEGLAYPYLQEPPAAELPRIEEELRRGAAAYLVQYWLLPGIPLTKTDGFVSGGLGLYLTCFRPPAKGSQLPVLTDDALAYLRILEDKGGELENEFRDGGGSGGSGQLWVMAYTLHTSTPHATRVRRAIQDELKAAPGREFKRSSDGVRFEPDELAALQTAYLAWARHGVTDPEEAARLAATRWRQVVEERLGLTWEEPGPDVPSPFVQAARLVWSGCEAYKDRAPWVQVGLPAALNSAVFAFSELRSTVVPYQYVEGAPRQLLPLTELLQATEAQLRQNRSPADMTARAFCSFLLAQPAEVTRAVLADPTKEGIERALGAPLAQVDARLQAFVGPWFD